jgi:hypothetical protein
MTLHLGKLPATYDSRDLRYSDLRAALPAIPTPRGGYGTDFPYWGMAGNGPADPDDHSLPVNWTSAAGGAGDCTIAGPAHETMEACHNAGRVVPTFSAKTCLEQYALLTQQANGTGYDPVSGSGDTGLDPRAVLEYRRKTGLLDDSGNVHKIGVYVAVEPQNLTDLWEALYLFEAVGIGINFPNSAMDQFKAGKPWSVVPGASIEGGHYIPLVGHPSAGTWTCVTWGKRQTITPSFLTTYCEEAFAYISADRYSQVTGKTLEGWRDADLEKFITLVGQPA